MQDRRQGVRDKVFMGGVAEINDRGSTMDCVVRNFSDRGACVELESSAKIPDEMRVTISRKGRSYLGRMIWRQANRVGLAFKAMVTDAPVDDLDVRLRRSEAKKRQLQRRMARPLVPRRHRAGRAARQRHMKPECSSGGPSSAS